MSRQFLPLVLVFGLGASSALRAQSAHPNVLVSTISSPEETAIAINPKNTQELVAGANISNQYYSTNGGQTWAWRPLNSPYGVWGDPCVVADTTGAFYFFHLSNPGGSVNTSFPFVDRMQVQRAATAATPFSFRGYFGLNPPKQ